MRIFLRNEEEYVLHLSPFNNYTFIFETNLEDKNEVFSRIISHKLTSNFIPFIRGKNFFPHRINRNNRRIFPSSDYWIPRSISREDYLWIVITAWKWRREFVHGVQSPFQKTSKRDAVVNRPSSIQEEEEEEEEEEERSPLLPITQRIGQCVFHTSSRTIDHLSIHSITVVHVLFQNARAGNWFYSAEIENTLFSRSRKIEDGIASAIALYDNNARWNKMENKKEDIDRKRGILQF